MPKKTKKQIRKMPATVESAASAPTSVTTSAFAPTMTAGRTSDTEFNPDYSETIKDLKRIGILASSFFILLIILSFFLR
jgi:hypothetical protein